MAGYVKIWVEIMHDSWFLGLNNSQRAVWFQLIVLAKSRGDVGGFFHRTLTGLADNMGIDRKSLGNTLRKFHTDGKIKLTMKRGKPIAIEILNYNHYQRDKKPGRSDTLNNVGAITGEKPAEVDPHNRTEENQTEQNLPAVSGSSNKEVVTGGSDHRQAVDYFCQRYQSHYQQTYLFSGGKDGANVKRLLAHFGLERLLRLIDELFDSTDKFYEEQGGRSIGVLSACANKLSQAISNPRKALAQYSPKTQDNIKRLAAATKRMMDNAEN